MYKKINIENLKKCHTELKEEIKNAECEQLVEMISDAPFLESNVFELYNKQEREQIKSKLLDIMYLVFDINELQVDFNNQHLEKLKNKNNLKEYIEELFT